jgi:cytochrome c-type biogenesis protein CcsB
MSTKLAGSTLGGIKEAPEPKLTGLTRYLPFAAPLLLAGVFILAQSMGWAQRLSTESPLVVLALILYIAASVFYVMFVLQKETLLENLATWTAALGFGLDIAAWGTRGLVAHHYPLSNLYDTALALGMTTAGASLVMTTVYRHRFVGAFTLPIATMFLILAILYGDQIIDMPPVLESYWRPIHVSIAMTAYGVCSLTFALGLLYLLKDGMKTELLGIFAMLVPLLTYKFVSGGSILSRGSFEVDLMIDGSRIPVNAAGTEFLRASIAGVGWLFLGAFTLSLLVILCFAWYLRTEKARWRTSGHWLARVVLLLQVVGLGALIYQMKTASSVASLIVPSQQALLQPAFLQEFGPRLELLFRGSPVGIASIFVSAAITAFIVVFAWQPERFLGAAPRLAVLDDLTYKSVTVAFPLLTLMTITGAVWANESWGRYWGWDPKEVGALVTCIFYALFLHTRLVHGWKGRKTAMFAVIGFISVIFTYLGVSFLLPGLHSYATL